MTATRAEIGAGLTREQIVDWLELMKSDTGRSDAEMYGDIIAQIMRITALERLLELRTSDLGSVAEERDGLKAMLTDALAGMDLIASFGGKTLLGSALDRELSMAHELGAAKAFEQAADIARSLVTRIRDTQGEPRG